jgi:23S rRNA (pseudouridine1915-N3)-methyltransferase
VLVRVVAVGRLRPYYRLAADDYLRRLRRFLRVEEVEVRDEARLAAAVPPDARRVALTREGAPWSSADLARRLRRWQEAARPVALLIGGAAGLDCSLRAGAHDRWSLGPLTLPHELARVVVLEQLYRGATILAGHPYHRS